MELSSTRYNEQIQRTRLALKEACCAGRRHGPIVALALLIALLNPLLCVIHCAMLHGAHIAAASVDQHAGHGGHNHAAMLQAGHDHSTMAHAQVAVAREQASLASLGGSLCNTARQAEETTQLMPRALYESAPLAIVLVALALLPLMTPLAAPGTLRPLLGWSPPTPPPRTFALA